MLDGRRIEWWYAAACGHAEADSSCGRRWECACGPCRAAREAGAKTEYDLLLFGAQRQIAYARAARCKK